MRTIAAITFGCKINQYETSCIIDSFTQHGYELIEFDKPADIFIINSCTVTNRTDQKSRTALRKALKWKEKNPHTIVIITGCYAQRNYDEIASLGDIDLIVDNNKKDKIYDLVVAITDHRIAKKEHFEDILLQDNFSELSTTTLPERSRAFVKVQDGCDYYCTYCAIPYARGHSRSRNPEKVLDQIKLLVENGYHEFVLAGINLGLYGQEKNDNYHLVELLEDIEAIEGVEIIRLSSVEPQLFSKRLLDFFSISKKMAHHFHIPLQSGSDEILAKMQRKYTSSFFKKNLEKIYNVYNDAAIGIDLIVGFPGETEELFNQTYSFLEGLDFTYLHLFSYSPKVGTPAATMSKQISGDEKRRRINLLYELSKKKTEEYLNKIIEKKTTLKGVIENRKDDQISTGLSDHYIRFYVKENLPKRSVVEMEICGKYSDGIEAKLK